MAVTFDNIGNGELAEQFKFALKAVGQNIMDPNMDPEASRGIDISLTFKPKKSGDGRFHTRTSQFCQSWHLVQLRTLFQTSGIRPVWA